MVNPLETPTFAPVAAICAGETLNALPTISENGFEAKVLESRFAGNHYWNKIKTEIEPDHLNKKLFLIPITTLNFFSFWADHAKNKVVI